MAGSESVKHLVVDSGAFIKNAPIKDIGQKIYTLRDVLGEIRDKDTRLRLQVLPYDISFREPSTEAIQHVTNFAKKTGDYRTLSAVDIRVLALTYLLEKEHVGTEHLKLEPPKNVNWTTTKRHLENPVEISGFYLNKKHHPNEQTEAQADEDVAEENQEAAADRLHPASLGSEDVSQDSDEGLESGDEIIEDLEPESPEHSDNTHTGTTESMTPTPSECSHDLEHFLGVSSAEQEVPEKNNIDDNDDPEDDDNDSNDDEDEDEEDEDDNDDGWITPSNLKQMKQAMVEEDAVEAEVTVGCLTTDFAMQNVLILMGLNIISIDGMLIKQARNYILRCFGCFKTTTEMTRMFCHHCGNKTLQKVAVRVKQDGTVDYTQSSRKAISTRGMRYSLPTPKGGKHSNNPLLVEDQIFPHQRTSKKGTIKYNAMDLDYMAHKSPFAPHDTESRAAQLGIRNQQNFQGKRNPNENRKLYGRRK